MSVRPFPEQPRVKGVAFRTVLVCLEQLRGADAVGRAEMLLSNEPASALRYGQIVPGGWYPIHWYKELLQSARDSTGEGYDLIRQIGRAATEHDTGTVYRVVLKLLSPGTIFSAYSRLFSSYYDTGTIDVIESRRGFLHLLLRGCSGFDRNMWEEIIGSAERLLELSGAKHVRLRVLSGGKDGDDSAEAELRWV